MAAAVKRDWGVAGMELVVDAGNDSITNVNTLEIVQVRQKVNTKHNNLFKMPPRETSIV